MKIIKRSALIALIITLVLFGIDTVGALSSSRDMLIQHEEWGGECSVTKGIGWQVLRFFPMSTPNNPAPSSPSKLSFDFISLVRVFVCALVLSLVISSIVACIYKKKFKWLLISCGSVAAIALLYFVGSKALDKFNQSPTGIEYIEVYTADINPGEYYTVLYPDVAYSLIPPDGNNEFGYCFETPLKIPVDKQVSKEQISRLTTAAEQLKSDSVRSGKGQPFAYKVDISISTRKSDRNPRNGGFIHYSFSGYNEVPESYKEFALIVNEICGGDYLSTNPQMADFNTEWFSKTFGVTEDDIPEGGSLDEFVASIVNGIENISGSDSHGSPKPFDPKLSLQIYEALLSDPSWNVN